MINPKDLDELKIKKRIYKAVYDLYKSTGCPYGDNDEGMMKWYREMKKKKSSEYKEWYDMEIRKMISETLIKQAVWRKCVEDGEIGEYMTKMNKIINNLKEVQND